MMSLFSPTNSAKGLSLFAHRIDEQLCNVLLDQLSSSLEEVEGGLSERCKPECRLVVMLIFYTMSFLAPESERREASSSSGGGAMKTPGMRTMDLTSITVKNLWTSLLTKRVPHYAIDSSRKIWQMVTITGYILTTYALERSQRLALLQGWSRETPGHWKHRLFRCLQLLDAVAKFADLSNMCLFLYGGMYPHLLYRWSGLHMTPIAGHPSTTTTTSSSSSSSSSSRSRSSIALSNPPGYSAAQLYVKSRQLLWEVMSGLLTASAVAVDWRRILIQCHSIVVGIGGQLHNVHAAVRSRVLRVVRQVVAVVVAGPRRWREGLRSLPVVGGRFGSERVDEGSRVRSWWDEVETDVGELGEVERNSGSSAMSGGSGSSGSSSSSGSSGSTGSSGSNSRSLYSCAWCGKSPPEAPHQSDCGHPFCYLCLRTKVLLSTAPLSATPLPPTSLPPTRRRGTGVEEEMAVAEGTHSAMVFRCPTCQTPVTTCARWSSRS